MMFSSYTYIIFYIMSIFFFNDTATTEIYTLSLHDALPIYKGFRRLQPSFIDIHDVGHFLERVERKSVDLGVAVSLDRKSTRLNSSHQIISYAVFCLKKKKQEACLARSPTAAIGSRAPQSRH